MALEPRNYLSHHGIKGMKWGVRRTPEQLGHVTGTGDTQQGNKSGEERPVSEASKKKIRDTIYSRVRQLRDERTTTPEIERYSREMSAAGKASLDYIRKMTDYERKKEWNAFWNPKLDLKYQMMRKERKRLAEASRQSVAKYDNAILSELISSFGLDDSSEMRAFLTDIIDQGDQEVIRLAYGDDDGND